jgi:hypothetical protein
LLGELIAETSTRYIYRRRHTSQTAFVEKGSPSIHIEPCQACPITGTLTAISILGFAPGRTGPTARWRDMSWSETIRIIMGDLVVTGPHVER